MIIRKNTLWKKYVYLSDHFPEGKQGVRGYSSLPTGGLATYHAISMQSGMFQKRFVIAPPQTKGGAAVIISLKLSCHSLDKCRVRAC